MRHKETERQRKKKARDREKKTETKIKKEKELDTCKARVAQLVFFHNFVIFIIIIKKI